MYNCPKCGSPLEPGYSVCPSCGEPVNVNVSPEMNPGVPTPPPVSAVPPIAPLPAESVPAGNEPIPVVPDPSAVLPTSELSSGVVAPAPINLASENTPPVVEVNPIQGMEVDTNSIMGTEIPTDTSLPEVVAPSHDNVSSLEQNIALPQTESEEESKEKEKKMNLIIFISVVCLSLLALALLLFFMIKMFSGKNDSINEKNLDQTKEYHYEGFYLYVPDDLYAEVQKKDFYIGDKEKTWSAVLTLGTGTYNTLVSNKNQLIDYFQQMGYEASEPVEKEVSGTSFVVTEVMMGTKNILVAYAKANGTQLFGVILENETGKYTDDDLKPIGTLIATMEYKGPYFELPDGLNLNSYRNTFSIAE